jgi:general secretion pathway protein I
MEFLVSKSPVEKGMTLIEVLVAMAIVAVALVALIRIQSQAIDIRPRLEQQFMATLLAENLLIEYELSPPTVEQSTLSGVRSMGVYDFQWQADISATSQASLRRIDVEVQLQSYSQTVELPENRSLENQTLAKGTMDPGLPDKNSTSVLAKNRSYRLTGFVSSVE